MAVTAGPTEHRKRGQRQYELMGELTQTSLLQMADEKERAGAELLQWLASTPARRLTRLRKAARAEGMLAQAGAARLLAEETQAEGMLRDSVSFDRYRAVLGEAWAEADQRVAAAEEEAEALALEVEARALEAEDEHGGEAAGTEPETVIKEARKPLGSAVREAWRSRRAALWIGTGVLLRFHTQMRLGGTWFLIRPFMDAVGKALIFGGLLRASGQGSVALNFLLPLAGLMGFRLFERTVFYTTRSLLRIRKIAKKVDLPLLLAPFGYSARPLIDFAAYALILAIAFAVFWGIDGTLYLEGPPTLLLALGGLALALLFAWSLGIWLAVLNAKVQDTRLTIRYVLEFWLYATPVLWPISRIPPQLVSLEYIVTYVNPMTGPVEMVKFGLLGADPPDPYSLVSTVGLTVVLAVSGAWFFNREAAKSLYGPEVDEDEMV